MEFLSLYMVEQFHPLVEDSYYTQLFYTHRRLHQWKTIRSILLQATIIEYQRVMYAQPHVCIIIVQLVYRPIYVATQRGVMRWLVVMDRVIYIYEHYVRQEFASLKNFTQLFFLQTAIEGRARCVLCKWRKLPSHKGRRKNGRTYQFSSLPQYQICIV